MKKSFIGILISAALASGAVAEEFCGIDHTIEAHSSHGNSVAKSSIRAVQNMGVPVVHEAIMYVQPSYFEKYGEYEGTRRILAMFDNHNAVYQEQGVDAEIRLVNIVPTVNVPDDLPFVSVVEDGNLVTRGAASTLHLVSHNPGLIEYDIAEKWKADHVGYIRERRDTDNNVAGLGSTGAGSFAWLDDGNLELASIVLSHEIGHNLRASHELEDSPNYVIEDAHAYRCNNKTSIMWSGSSATSSAAFFSDPNLVMGGEPCGDVDTANNLRVIREGVIEASLWREGVVSHGVVSFSEGNYTVSEDTDLEVRLTRTGNLDVETSVKIYPVNGTAVFGEDFYDVWVEVVFEPGQEAATAVIDIAQDISTEDNESFDLEMRFPFGLTLDDNSTVPVVIEEAVPAGYPGEFSIRAAGGFEGDRIELTILRESGNAGDVVIDVVAGSGTAETGVDYTPINTSLLFLAGETSKVLSLETFDDGNIEPTEKVQVTISSQANVDFGVSEIDIEIKDDDSTTPGRVSINQLTSGATVTEGGTTSVELIRSQGFMGELAGTLELQIGTSTTSTPFSIPDGAGSFGVEIDIPDNTVDEPNYTGTLTLTVSTPDGVASTDPVNITIIDNDASPAPQPSPSSGGGGSLGIIGLLMLGLTGLRRGLK